MRWHLLRRLVSICTHNFKQLKPFQSQKLSAHGEVVGVVKEVAEKRVIQSVVDELHLLGGSFEPPVLPHRLREEGHEPHAGHDRNCVQVYEDEMNDLSMF
jgi:hypothetical protein